MGHRLIEEEMERQNKEKYPGSFDAEYSGRADLRLTPDVTATFSWTNPKSYKLDASMIHDLEDVKDVLEAMNLTMMVYDADITETQQRLINNKTFKKQ